MITNDPFKRRVPTSWTSPQIVEEKTSFYQNQAKMELLHLKLGAIVKTFCCILVLRMARRLTSTSVILRPILLLIACYCLVVTFTTYLNKSKVQKSLLRHYKQISDHRMDDTNYSRLTFHLFDVEVRRPSFCKPFLSNIAKHRLRKFHDDVPDIHSVFIRARRSECCFQVLFLKQRINNPCRNPTIFPKIPIFKEQRLLVVIDNFIVKSRLVSSSKQQTMSINVCEKFPRAGVG